jgi:hypothetical protein
VRSLGLGLWRSFAAAVAATPSSRLTEVAEIVCEVSPGRLEELFDSVVGLLQPHMCVKKLREQLIVAGISNIMVTSLGESRF